MGYASQSYAYHVKDNFAKYVITDLRLPVDARLLLAYCVDPCKYCNGATYTDEYSVANAAKALGMTSDQVLKVLTGIPFLKEIFPDEYSTTNQLIHVYLQGLHKIWPDFVKATPVTTAYYIKIFYKNSVYYKIGITCGTVKNRFKDEKVEIKNVTWREFGSRDEAYLYEQSVLSDYSAYLYKGEPILSSGNSEIFIKDVLNLDKPGVTTLPTLYRHPGIEANPKHGFIDF